MKPQAALRHPFVSAGKTKKIITPTPSSSKSSGLGFSSSRSSKVLTDTPKKSQISAPTPLTARTSRVTTGVAPTTPSSNSGSVHASLGSSRSYRSSQTQSLSYHSSHSSRTMVCALPLFEFVQFANVGPVLTARQVIPLYRFRTCILAF